ncbi:flagellar FliJ family protein [Desulfitobacterium metallireducens]|uniref:Flagellar FliJ protein n=1 Tax=Desulfitobacterium metallireducens DSM 15288 TaxID=871968 RepID=W0EAA0_9FIRM|nr:flagellar FliJ family protein [Desulfitobacterium metallireducens]AHF07785.1 flagellar protein FliJ [Desulfitobacterium metallireducens DSM 15288]
MPQFKFRLDAPLRLAERELENERRCLAKELEKLHQKKTFCIDKEKQWQKALEGQREAGLKEPEHLGSWQEYAVSLLQQLRKLQQELELQEKVVDVQRLRVRNAHQEQEKLKKLKEKQEAAFWLKEQRREQKALDETGQVIFIRQQEQQKSETEDGTYL